MTKVIFDIETIGRDFESFDEKQQEYLLKFAEDDEEREETKQKLALWGVTGEVVAIGMLNPETGKSMVYYRNLDTNLHESARELYPSTLRCDSGFRVGESRIADENNNERTDTNRRRISTSHKTVGDDKSLKCVEVENEKELLEKFWEDIKKFRQFITFNGRAFDCPFLILRSGILGVKPSRDLMTHRYESEIHIDLLELLTFHGIVRKFNLDFYAKIFGIESPKAMMNGLEVKKMFTEGEGLEIAKYCHGDLVATEKLWERWRDFMRGN